MDDLSRDTVGRLCNPESRKLPLRGLRRMQQELLRGLKNTLLGAQFPGPGYDVCDQRQLPQFLPRACGRRADCREGSPSKVGIVDSAPTSRCAPCIGEWTTRSRACGLQPLRPHSREPCPMPRVLYSKSRAVLFSHQPALATPKYVVTACRSLVIAPKKECEGQQRKSSIDSHQIRQGLLLTIGEDFLQLKLLPNSGKS
jgi:hypothetical protein